MKTTAVEDRKRKVVDLPLGAEAHSTPACSEAQKEGAQGRSTMRSVALDLGKRISFCEVSSKEVVGRKMVSGLDQLERELGKDKAPARVAIEACREAWAAAKWLEERGHEVLLVDTTRVRALGIGHHNRKTDRIDAETLARAVERELIPEAHLLSEPQQEVRIQLGIRRALVETRTNLVVTIRGILRARGCRIGRGDAEDFVKTVRAAELTKEDRASVDPLVHVLEALSPELETAERRLIELSNREPIVKKLQTVPGVGPIIAAAFVSVLDTDKRFKKAHQVESYLGLVPSEFTSGKRQLGAITKRGNAYLRALLVQASWNVLRKKTADREPLVAWAHQVSERRGKKIAVLAVARKLAGILWAMWRDNVTYDAVRTGRESARGKRALAGRDLATADAYERAAARARHDSVLGEGRVRS